MSRQFFKGCVCCSQDETIGVVHNVFLSFSMGTSATNGYWDIEVRADLRSHNSNIAFTPKDERVNLGKLKFDGQQYNDTTRGELGKLFERRQRLYEEKYKQKAKTK